MWFSWKWEMYGVKKNGEGRPVSTTKYFSKKAEAKKFAEENHFEEFEISRVAWSYEIEESVKSNVIS